MHLFFIIIFSAVAASFFSMLIYRLNNSVSLLEPKYSVCPHCRHRLFFFDLVPIFSFLLLKGHCRYCHKKIAFRYFLLELIFVFLAIVSFLLNLSWYVFLLNMVMLAIIFSDLLYKEIPVVFMFLVFGLLFFPDYLRITQNWQNIFIVLGLLIFIKILEKFYYKKEVFGGADIILYSIFSLYFSFPKVILLIYLSFLIGAIIGLLLLLTKICQRKDFIPFAPFIILAFYLVLIWGDKIFTWYNSLTNV